MDGACDPVQHRGIGLQILSLPAAMRRPHRLAGRRITDMVSVGATGSGSSAITVRAYDGVVQPLAVQPLSRVGVADHEVPEASRRPRQQRQDRGHQQPAPSPVQKCPRLPRPRQLRSLRTPSNMTTASVPATHHPTDSRSARFRVGSTSLGTGSEDETSKSPCRRFMASRKSVEFR